MSKKYIHPRILAAFLLFSVAWCAGDEAPGSVVVEVFGYGSAEAGQSISKLHRQAIRDALENALLQAQVELDVQVSLEGMRLKDSRMHSRSMGYIESSRVLEAGFVPTTNSLAVYRVRMQVSMRPIPEDGIFSDAWKRRFPVVALDLVSGQGDEHERACREVLAASLRECGIRVVALDEDPHAFPVRVVLARSSSGVPWEIRWEMRRSSLESSVLVYEYMLIPGGDLVASAELEQLGVRMAKDALRFRCEPVACSTNKAGRE